MPFANWVGFMLVYTWFFPIKKKKENCCFGHSNDFAFGLWCLFTNCILEKWKGFRDESSILVLTLLEGELVMRGCDENPSFFSSVLFVEGFGLMRVVCASLVKGMLLANVK